MRIRRSNPFQESIESQQRFDRLLESSSLLNRITSQTLGISQESYSYPPIDLIDNGDAFVLVAFLPGINADGIHLSVIEQTVTLKGSRQPPTIEGAKPLLRERLYGQFHTSVDLPELVSADEINAQYTDGVLQVVLPKQRSLRPKTIAIN